MEAFICNMDLRAVTLQLTLTSQCTPSAINAGKTQSIGDLKSFSDVLSFNNFRSISASKFKTNFFENVIIYIYYTFIQF